MNYKQIDDCLNNLTLEQLKEKLVNIGLNPDDFYGKSEEAKNNVIDYSAKMFGITTFEFYIYLLYAFQNKKQAITPVP